MMMHQNTPEEDEICYFISDLEGYLKYNRIDYLSRINLIIDETHLLSSGKDIYEINRDYFLVIYFLYRQRKEYFQALKKEGENNEYSQQQYEEIYHNLLTDMEVVC